MLHCIKYEIIKLLRTKVMIFWLLGFPIILGTLFYGAFKNLSKGEELFSKIPVALIEGDSPVTGLWDMLSSLSEGEDSLLEIKTKDLTKAKAFLESGEICGIIYSDKEIKLELFENAGIKEGIINSILNGFKTKQAIIYDVLNNHPERLPDVLKNLSDDIQKEREGYINSSSNSANKDPYVQYFYNLIAMCGIFGSILGMWSAINYQANLSAIGARIELSPSGKLKSAFSALISSIFIHNILINIAALYFIFVLKINFGVSFGVIILINLLSVIIGNCFGCLTGSIGSMKEQVKNSLMMGISLSLCFFSGLMFSSMRLIIEETFPIFNRINPTALIVDCFYSICVYGGYEQFIKNIIILITEIALMIIGISVMMRKRKYKSI